jgi:hypothetical protein
MIKPITPEELEEHVAIPDFVIEAVNNLLKSKYRGNYDIVLKQKEVMDAVIANSPQAITSEKVFAEKWLDFEYIYRNNGWGVIYDKPGYDENYDAFFKFSKKK